MDHNDRDMSSLSSSSSPQSSPLRSLSESADTLSLRQSHLNNSYPNTLDMVQEYSKSIAAFNHTSSHRHINQLVQYPPDIISTTVEKGNAPNTAFQSQSRDILSFNSNHYNYNNNLRFKLNSKQKTLSLKRLSSQESITENTSAVNNIQNTQNDCHDFDDQSVVSESGFSGVESSNSGQFSVSTSIECFSSTHLFNESKTTSTQSTPIVMVNEYVQVNITDDKNGPLFELKRSNANMKGKLEQLDYIVDEMVKERSILQMKIHSLEKELKVKCENIEERSSQMERLITENDELKSGLSKWESIVTEYQDVVQAKSLEIEANNEDIKQMSSQNEKLRIDCEHLKIDLESKENQIKELNKRCAQISIEFDSLIQNKVNLEEEIKRIRGESDAITNQKEWCETEINKLQVKLNETQQKLVLEREASVSIRNDYQKTNSLNAALKQQINDIKRKSVKEKEALMRHLEGIEVDLVLKEAENQYSLPKLDESKLLKTGEFVSSNLNEKLKVREIEFEKISNELLHSNELNEKLIKEHEININDINKLKKHLNDTNYELNALKSYSSDLELKIRGLNVDLKRQRELSEMLRKDKRDSESKLTALTFDNKTLESASKLLKETIEKNERSLKQLQSNLIAKETKLEHLEKEKHKLTDLVNIKEQELSQIKQSSTQTKISNSSADPNLIELEIEKNELQRVVTTLSADLRSNLIKYEDEKSKILAKCSELQSRLNDEKVNLENLNQKFNDEIRNNNSLRTELETIKLEKYDMQTQLDSLRITDKHENSSDNYSEIIQIKDEKIRCLESNVKLLMKKYKETLKLKKENELKVENLLELSSNVNKSFVSTQTEDFNDINEQININDEINRLQELIKTKDSIIEDTQQIILNLEHEKGRLSSAGDSSVNQHIKELQLLVASKSEEVTVLSEKLNQSKQSLKELESKLNKKIVDVESELKKERAIVKDLRHSIFADKRENNYLKKDLSELKNALTTANSIADKRKQEVINSESELKKQKDLELSIRNEVDKLNNELRYLREDNSKLKSKIDESLGKNEPILEQMKNLSLNLLEKNQEIKAVKSENESIKAIFDTEIQGLKHKISNYRNDIELLTSDLNEVRKEKFSLQSRLIELRIALKNEHQLNKKLRDQLKNCEINVSEEDIYNEELVSKLLDQSFESSKENKPLLNLQACVESLKQEMELLQQQIVDHSN